MAFPRVLLVAAMIAPLSPAAAAAPTATRAERGPVKKLPGTTKKRSAEVYDRGPLVRKPRFRIGVQFVRTADDDGSDASTLRPEDAEIAIARTNEIWARNGGDVQFYIHRSSNFDDHIRRTTLNQDCLYRPGWNAAKVAQTTEPDLDGDGKPATKQDKAVICEPWTADLERTAYGAERLDRIVVFSRGGNEKMVWNDEADHWEVGHAYGGWSNPVGTHVVMPPRFNDTTLLAHELGHYLPAGHTFGRQPATIEQARDLMERWVADHPDSDPAATFDPDSRQDPAVLDTPPDPSIALWKAAWGDHCLPHAKNVVVQIKVNGHKRSVTLSPNRQLVMSYFKGCDFDFYISSDQYARVRKALLEGNRRPLIERDSSCYTSGWRPGEPVTTTAALAAIMRRVARCELLANREPPWEIDGRQIYANPADTKVGKRGRRAQGVQVQNGRERKLLRQLQHRPAAE